MTRAETSPLQIRVVTAAIILGTFLCGAAVGAGAYHWAAPRHGPPPLLLPLFELGLSGEQEAAVRRVFERHHAELEAILRESFPKVRAINEQMEREVRALLTPEQQKRLDVLKASRPERHGPPFGGPGMGPPPGLFPPPPPPAAERSSEDPTRAPRP